MKYLEKTFKILSSSFVLFFVYLIVPKNVLAVCPVCTIAVGAGLGLSRYFGIDDSVTGIWIGGLIVSLTIWTAEWLRRKNWKILKKASLPVFYFMPLFLYLLLTYPPLFWAGVIGHPFNTFFGVDKLIFGGTLGMVAFMIGVFLDKKTRSVKGGQFFSYQKVVFPILSLTIISLVVYYYGGYLPR